jgi:hypothetical protein
MPLPSRPSGPAAVGMQGGCTLHHSAPGSPTLLILAVVLGNPAETMVPCKGLIALTFCLTPGRLDLCCRLWSRRATRRRGWWSS